MHDRRIRTSWPWYCAIWALAVSIPTAASLALEFPGTPPGEAQAELRENVLTLSNGVLKIRWDLAPRSLKLVEFENRLAGARRELSSPIAALRLADGRTVSAADMTVEGPIKLQRCDANPQASRLSERLAGWQASAQLKTGDPALSLGWRVTLRDGANYAVQEILIADEAVRKQIATVILVDTPLQDAVAVGEVDGSPIQAKGIFVAAEDPLARNVIQDGKVTCSVRCDASAGNSDWRASAAIGVVPLDQQRRGFLNYVERERARPYRLFVHYNSWWDIAWGDRKMNEAECLDVIRSFGESLTRQRGASLDSFCFDDGWDDNRTLWKFHSGFPKGFTPLRDAARACQSGLGVWLSPWGGYGQAKDERMQYGKSQGFETNENGFSLAGPVYYARYRDACLGMIRDYDCNYFKFDGIARGVGSAGAGDQFAPDVAALLRLIRDLRAARPDVFVNITTGTWPSPYWLWHGDSIWRNGDDVGFFGEGSVRERSITYRDMTTYRMIARRAPWYPLNSLMICSVVYAQRGTAKEMNYDTKDLADEIRMAFAGGTQCLELYMTPALMKGDGWDVLAEAMRWAREHNDVLVDSHWIGGDPGNGEAYGYASWAPRKGILALRNPIGRSQSITLDLATAFECEPKSYVLASPWKADSGRPKLTIKSGEKHTFELEPFETRVLEAVPQ